MYLGVGVHFAMAGLWNCTYLKEIVFLGGTGKGSRWNSPSDRLVEGRA